jgi:hypothetical protein
MFRTNGTADPGNRPQILNALRQLGIMVSEAADLGARLKDLLLIKLQAVEPLIKLKAHGRRTGNLLSLSFTLNDHWLPAAAGGNSIPSISNSDLMRCFIPTISLTKVSRS